MNMPTSAIYKRTIIEEITRYLRTDDVVVLHGARQVGKTSILYYLQNLLREKGETTYYIDLEDSRFVRTLDQGAGEFIKLLREEGFKIPAAKKIYVFIDEIHYLAKDIDKFNKLLEALASQSGQLLNISELSNTTRIAKQTVEKYLFTMEQTYIIKLVRPFSRNLRSELFKLPRIYFYDPGLMQMLWLKGLQKEVVGNVFETAVFSELIKKYGQESVFYWRTKDKKEIDFILRIKNEVLPLEVKLNFEQFSRTAIDYFCRHYETSKYKIVGLNGQQKNDAYIYPWDL